MVARPASAGCTRAVQTYGHSDDTDDDDDDDDEDED